jgi:hypothetical protein
MPQPGISFVVDRFPHPENLFSFRGVQVGPGEANKFTAVINAHRNALEKQANNARQAVSHLEKKARRKELKLMLHAVMAMTLAHELAHAFGINRSSEFRGLPLEELEILTDSCAFLSCHKMIGNAAVLGMNYLQKRLNGEGLSITSVEKTTELAKAIVAGVKRNEP